MINMKIIKEKFEKDVFENLEKENFNKIIIFLRKEKCVYIEEIVLNYLDLFNIQYHDFVKKYNILNKKYDGKFLKNASENMNLLEDFYEV